MVDLSGVRVRQGFTALQLKNTSANFRAWKCSRNKSFQVKLIEKFSCSSKTITTYLHISHWLMTSHAKYWQRNRIALSSNWYFLFFSVDTSLRLRGGCFALWGRLLFLQWTRLHQRLLRKGHRVIVGIVKEIPLKTRAAVCNATPVDCPIRNCLSTLPVIVKKNTDKGNYDVKSRPSFSLYLYWYKVTITKLHWLLPFSSVVDMRNKLERSCDALFMAHTLENQKEAVA